MLSKHTLKLLTSKNNPLGLFYLLILSGSLIGLIINTFVFEFSYSENWLILLLLILVFFQIILLTKGFSERILANINLLTMFGYFQLILLQKTDYYHVVVFWLALLPILVTVTVNPKDTYIWYILSGVFVVGNGIYTYFLFPSYMVEVFPMRFMAAGLLYVGLTLTGGSIYNWFRNQQQLELEQQKKELQKLYNRLEEEHLQLKSAQNQLVQSEKMASLGTLSAGISHELNNPLNFIHVGIEELATELHKENLEHPEKVEKYVQIIKEGVIRSTSIVKGLKQFSRQTTNMNESCNLHEIIENCLTILGNELKNKTQVVKHFSSSKIILYGNAGRLHQAFLNLLANASQAIETEGKIEIKTEVSEDEVSLSISDDGIGIEPVNQVKIFEPFFTTKPPGHGTGLGLYITYQIIKEHQGDITVHSDGKTGTTFSVKFDKKLLGSN